MGRCRHPGVKMDFLTVGFTSQHLGPSLFALHLWVRPVPTYHCEAMLVITGGGACASAPLLTSGPLSH